MNVTVDFGTAVWAVVGIAVGWGVYRWTAPAVPTTPTARAVGMTMGERLVAAPYQRGGAHNPACRLVQGSSRCTKCRDAVRAAKAPQPL